MGGGQGQRHELHAVMEGWRGGVGHEGGSAGGAGQSGEPYRKSAPAVQEGVERLLRRKNAWDRADPSLC